MTLVGGDGSRYPASGIVLLSGPHVLYNPPPSISLGIGGFGFTGCCSAIGSGVGVGLPVGKPTVAEASDQYIASALIPVPADYASNWLQYHVEVAPYRWNVNKLARPSAPRVTYKAAPGLSGRCIRLSTVRQARAADGAADCSSPWPFLLTREPATDTDAPKLLDKAAAQPVILSCPVKGQ